jgi:hypothetical protein
MIFSKPLVPPYGAPLGGSRPCYVPGEHQADFLRAAIQHELVIRERVKLVLGNAKKAKSRKRRPR